MKSLEEIAAEYMANVEKYRQRKAEVDAALETEPSYEKRYKLRMRSIKLGVWIEDGLDAVNMMQRCLRDRAG